MTFGNPDFVKYAEAYGAKGLAREGDGGSGPDARGRPSRLAACTWSPCRSTTRENTRVLVEELRGKLEPAE